MGNKYGYPDFVQSTRYGEVDGLCGANCYHDFYSFVPGVSVPSYTQKELDELNAKENTPIEYNGKQYTAYEATQRQRALERAMRAQRQDIKLLELGGANEDDIINARARYRGTSAEYVRFSKAMNLPQQRERVTIDGLGNIGVGKYKKALTNAAGKPIIKVKKTKLTAEPNSITQKESSKGGIERNYYDENGLQFKQISNNDHGHKAESGFGKHGEHAHDYYIDDKGIPKHGKPRELTDDERKENSDIL